ncbi:MAG: protoheme IX farnesyltransferase [Betaproteobacteria bacterium]|nr:protoheme IX farnesyltransferase [Betaproteobacteria bacterium]
MSQTGDAGVAQPRALGAQSRARLFFDLFKLRIGLVIGLTALAGMAVAPGPPLPGWRILGLALAVTTAAAAAGAYNQYAERDLDARMGRTRRRAFVTGRLHPGRGWLAAIIALGALGIALGAVATNVVAAGYIFLGAFTYGVVYTAWLKRRTWWNIVVGGLAGSFAVLAGAAAAAPSAPAPLPLAFALILFLWTPPHFWSLAIAFRPDYEAAGIPMLPVVVGDERAARAIFAGSILLVIASFIPALIGLGWLYLFAAASGGYWLLLKSAQLVIAPSRHAAMVNFHASLAQLALLLVAAIADAALLA